MGKNKTIFHDNILGTDKICHKLTSDLYAIGSMVTYTKTLRLIALALNISRYNLKMFIILPIEE